VERNKRKQMTEASERKVGEALAAALGSASFWKQKAIEYMNEMITAKSDRNRARGDVIVLENQIAAMNMPNDPDQLSGDSNQKQK